MTPLSTGTQGTGVAQLQAWLNLRPGATPIAVDGDFGPMTLAALISFQQSHGIVGSGIADLETIGSVVRELVDTAVRRRTPELRNGGWGEEVSELQRWLNRIPVPGEPDIAVDGEFGDVTEARVASFQKIGGLTVDGIVGPLTFAGLAAAQTLLDVPVALSGATVTPITSEILGTSPDSALIQQTLIARSFIDNHVFVPGTSDKLPFFNFPTQVCRLGIFAARLGAAERCVIVVLPAEATPERVVFVTGHGFSQNAAKYGALGWTNPRSKALIDFVLTKHVMSRYGPQATVCTVPTALFNIVRAAPGRLAGVGHELGPFHANPLFVWDITREIARLTDHAFSARRAAALGFSSGVADLQSFVDGLQRVFSLQVVVNVDPNPATPITPIPGATMRQYLSGMTSGGGKLPDFEWMPQPRWVDEPFYAKSATNLFGYLHNHALPGYSLHIALETT